jgi:hypothetical protein
VPIELQHGEHVLLQVAIQVAQVGQVERPLGAVVQTEQKPAQAMALTGRLPGAATSRNSADTPSRGAAVAAMAEKSASRCRRCNALSRAPNLISAYLLVHSMNGKQLDPCAGREPQFVSEATDVDGERAPADPAKAGYRNTPNPLKMLFQHGTPRGKAGRRPAPGSHPVGCGRWIGRLSGAPLPDPQVLGRD